MEPTKGLRILDLGRLLRSGLLILISILLTGLAVWYIRSTRAQHVVKGVVSSVNDTVKSTAGRSNILLMGIGGEGHEGADLTDSMLVASLALDKHELTLVSLPRDLWVPSLKAKINTAYHYGNEKREGGGRDLAKSAVAEMLGIPIHYVVVVDFQGFVKAIDAVGGIDVTVDRTFDDYKYPISGKETAEPESARYEHLHFEAGPLHLDGATALKFARSRHAEGDEGTDFARSMRQAKIIQAFRAKLLSSSTLLSKDALTALKASVTTSLDTDIGEIEQAAFAKYVLTLDMASDRKTLDLTDYVVNPKNTKEYGGAWVLIPSPSLEKLHEYVQTELAK
jgi:LCP family protein required for cell wall assembly